MRRLAPLMMMFAAWTPAAAADGGAGRQAILAATGALLQADGRRARALLAAIPADALDAKDRRDQACMIARLDGVAAPAGNVRASSVADRALALYRTYWRIGVMAPERRSAAEQVLLRGLARLLARPDLAGMDAAEPLLAARLEQEGLHSLQGKTGLLRDLMIWAKQERKIEQVALPEGGNATAVYYLDDFLSQGWSNYLSCDRTGTGGWTKPDGLYVVVPGYASLSDENFRVNFLAHESQHFADHRRFPALAGWELEYRAKLVELAYATETRERVLARFASSQGDDPGDAHSYANKRVLAALGARLGLGSSDDLAHVPVAALQQAAIAELRADTDRRAADIGRAP